MTKRKSKTPRKSSAATPDVATPAAAPESAVPAVHLAGLEAEKLEAAPETETRLPELPVQEIQTESPPLASPELESEPVAAYHLAELRPDVALPVETPAEANELARAATGEAATSGPSPKMDRPPRAIAGMEACQALFMEMARDNLDFAASLASIRSPLDILGVATSFASRRIGMYSRFSNAITDIVAGRQAPMS
jgi:hypothetical protein